MKKIKIIIYALFFITLFSCVTKVPMDPSFYNEKKVGVIVQVDSINRFKEGAQGLLDMAISSGAKYKDALSYIGTQVKPEPYFRTALIGKLDNQNKSYIFIEDKIDLNSFSKFDKSENDSKVKYYDKDLRSLKDKYNVDQLIIVDVRYGLTIGYYSMIETGKGGSSYVRTDIIDLENNSVLYRDVFVKTISFSGKWNTPPHYDKLKENIEQAVLQSATELNKKL
jgi:hypothetical protein